MNTYTLYWRTGKRETVEGPSPHEAMTLAGYSQGAVAALDFYASGDCTGYVWNPDTTEWDMTPEYRMEIFGETNPKGTFMTSDETANPESQDTGSGGGSPEKS